MFFRLDEYTGAPAAWINKQLISVPKKSPKRGKGGGGEKKSSVQRWGEEEEKLENSLYKQEKVLVQEKNRSLLKKSMLPLIKKKSQIRRYQKGTEGQRAVP